MPRIPASNLRPPATGGDVFGGDFLDKLIRVIEGFEKIMQNSGRAEGMVQNLLPKPETNMNPEPVANAAPPAPNPSPTGADVQGGATPEKQVADMDKQTVAAHVAAAVDGIDLKELLTEAREAIPAEYADLSVRDLLERYDAMNGVMRAMLETFVKRKISERLVAQVLR